MQRVSIHHQHPNPRSIRSAVEILQQGGLVGYPTDTVYGIGCDLENRSAVEKLYSLQTFPKNRPLTFLFADLAEISSYAIVSNYVFRILKRYLPGPYTFILEATRGFPAGLLTRRRTIGVRISSHEVPQALCRALGRPILTSSAKNAQAEITGDPDEIEERYKHGLSLLLDAGEIWPENSSMISLLNDTPEILREGKGSVEDFQ